jgi:hypothetical protein
VTARKRRPAEAPIPPNSTNAMVPPEARPLNGQEIRNLLPLHWEIWLCGWCGEYHGSQSTGIPVGVVLDMLDRKGLRPHRIAEPLPGAES